MKNKILKIFSTLSFFLMASPVFCYSYASDVDIKSYFKNGNSNNIGNIIPFGADIYQIIYAVGIAIATIMILIIGIQYMSAKPAKKADLKERLILFICGFILLIAGVKLMDVIVNSIKDLKL